MNAIPTPEEVKEYFSKAKEIRCLRLDIILNIEYCNNFNYDDKTNSYTTLGGVVVVWKEGNFAEITKKRCEKKCPTCKCKD